MKLGGDSKRLLLIDFGSVWIETYLSYSGPSWSGKKGAASTPAAAPRMVGKGGGEVEPEGCFSLILALFVFNIFALIRTVWERQEGVIGVTVTPTAAPRMGGGGEMIHKAAFY